MNNFRIPADRLNLAVRTAYNLSQPQGMGFLHFNPAPMTEEQANRIVPESIGDGMVYLDYVSGRAVKLCIRRDDEGHYVEDNGTWYDHTGAQWEEFKRIVTEGA